MSESKLLACYEVVMAAGEHQAVLHGMQFQTRDFAARNTGGQQLGSLPPTSCRLL